MNKKIMNTAVFFTLLWWLAAWLLVFRHKVIVAEVTPAVWGGIIGGNIVLILLSRWLIPVFEAISKVTAKTGALIFGLISIVVFFLILTPIALFKRMLGKHMMATAYNPAQESYYEEWDASADITKQF